MMHADIRQATDALTALLRDSAEYREYLAAQESMKKDELVSGIYETFRRLQLEVQADSIANENDPSKQDKLKRCSELLQMHTEAADFLMAEYKLHALLGDIYQSLANSVGIDLSVFENG